LPAAGEAQADFEGPKCPILATKSRGGAHGASLKQGFFV
jgi:hypothetical protein